MTDNKRNKIMGETQKVATSLNGINLKSGFDHYSDEELVNDLKGTITVCQDYLAFAKRLVREYEKYGIGR